jgi:hypothetical protein
VYSCIYVAALSVLLHTIFLGFVKVVTIVQFATLRMHLYKTHTSRYSAHLHIVTHNIGCSRFHWYAIYTYTLETCMSHVVYRFPIAAIYQSIHRCNMF